jgi:hypothetical protein
MFVFNVENNGIEAEETADLRGRVGSARIIRNNPSRP